MQAQRIIPDLQCSLVCEDVRREANGKFILIGCLNFLVVPQFPCGLRILVFNQWTSGLGQFRENVRILAPDQTTVISKGEVKFALQDAGHHATNLNVFGLKLEKPGIHFVEVLVDDVMKLRYPMPVLIAQQPPEGQQPNPPSK